MTLAVDAEERLSEAERVALRAIEGGAVDAEAWAWMDAPGGTSRDRLVLEALERKLSPIAGEPIDLTTIGARLGRRIYQSELSAIYAALQQAAWRWSGRNP